MRHVGPPNVTELETQKNVPALIEALGYAPDWVLRRDAVEALGRVGDMRASDALRRAQSDTSPEVREAAHIAGGDLAVRLVDASQQAEGQEDASEFSERYLRSLGGGGSRRDRRKVKEAIARRLSGPRDQ